MVTVKITSLDINKKHLVNIDGKQTFIEYNHLDHWITVSESIKFPKKVFLTHVELCDADETYLTKGCDK